jgi:hypothetical protein
MAPVLKAGHQFIVDRLTDVLGVEKAAWIERFVRQDSNFREISQLFQPDGHPKLLFYFQSPSEGDTGWGAHKDVPELFMTTGENERLRGRCIFFARTVGSRSEVRNPETDLVSGEILGPSLKCAWMMLDHVFQPMLKVGIGGAQGTEKSARQEFQGVLGKFSDCLHEAVESLQLGIELRMPDERYDIDNKQSFINKAALDADLVAHFEEVDPCLCRRALLHRFRWRASQRCCAGSR